MHAFLKPGVILLCGIAASVVVYASFTAVHKADVLQRAHVIAQGIDAAELTSLSGASADSTNPTYLGVKAYLESVRESDPNIRFVYVLGRNAEGQLFFYADSEDDSLPDASPPGQVYYEATPEMHAVIEDGVARTEGPDRDRWGVWMSAHAAIGNPPVALLGIDIPAGDYFQRALKFSLVPFFASLVLLMYLLWRAHHHKRKR